MDLLLVQSQDKIRLIALNVHGILWLQTHFAVKDWEALNANKVVLSGPNAKVLSQDAKKAGIRISELSELSLAA